MWTETVSEGVTEVQPPLFDDDSVATEPFVRAMTVEGPTTIFDPPVRGSCKIARLRRPTSESELEESYEEAMRQFF